MKQTADGSHRQNVDVFGRSCVQTAEKLHISVDGFYKLRRRAYQKLADAFNS